MGWIQPRCWGGITISRATGVATSKKRVKRDGIIKEIEEI